MMGFGTFAPEWGHRKFSELIGGKLKLWLLLGWWQRAVTAVWRSPLKHITSWWNSTVMLRKQPLSEALLLWTRTHSSSVELQAVWLPLCLIIPQMNESPPPETGACKSKYLHLKFHHKIFSQPHSQTGVDFWTRIGPSLFSGVWCTRVDRSRRWIFAMLVSLKGEVKMHQRANKVLWIAVCRADYLRLVY